MLTRFFKRYELDMTDADVGALDTLLALSDNELMDLFLARVQLIDAMNTPSVARVLTQIQSGGEAILSPA